MPYLPLTQNGGPFRPICATPAAPPRRALPAREADPPPGVRSRGRRPAERPGAYALCVVPWRRGPGGSPLSLHRQPARLSCEERTVALLGPCCCAGPVVRQPRVAAASRANAPEHGR